MIKKDVVFHLHEEYEVNYYALQNFLNDFVPLKEHKRKQSGSNGTSSKNKIVESQNCKCVDCDFIFHKDSFRNYPKATVEHVIPHRYGSTRALNSEFLCQKCNNKRELCRETRMNHVLRYFGTIG